MRALLALCLLPTLARAADCERATLGTDVLATLDAAEAAYARVDVEAFEAAVVQARAEVSCLQEAVTPAVAAQLHRLEGLSAFVEDARDRAVTAFAAARSLEPDYSFPSTVVPPGNPVIDQYLARPATSATERLPPPADGKLRLDGRPGEDRPLELPVLLQVIDPEGRPGVTAYLWPGDALPYTPGRTGSPARTGLRIGGVGLAAAGLVTLAVGATTGPRGAADLDAGFAAARRNDALVGVGSTLLGVGGASLGVSFAMPVK